MYIEMRNIEKSYGDFKASKEVNFGLKKGTLAALLGPSGSGKTTILRMIAGFETPDTGDIMIDEKRVNDLPAADRGIGFVFQNYALFRYMTVYENIAFGLEVKKINKKLIKERVMELLSLTGLEGLEKRYPNQLSGGQRQVVAVARAVSRASRVIVLDEPTAALGARQSRIVLDTIEATRARGIAVLLVSHDLPRVLDIADRIVVMRLGAVAAQVDPRHTTVSEVVALMLGESRPEETGGRQS